ncbi:hypothetical protein M3175_09550 [Robertmurraya korlensis]|uniref:hypothetical protein n=1 Tax=Robertmurraya korlensis TaxID=519977 RepID=UPI0020405F3C|nr:hypothetical protein [Robertmurraya korlensis]MCM3600975.1 hypothetical protein [Robertmurraya korlensis]
METAVVNQQFTYHKKSGYTGFIIAMICVCMLETVGVSYLLYKWSPVLHWIHLFLSVSTILFLILDLRAVSKNPIILQNEELVINVGLRPAVHIQLPTILEIKSGKLNFENDRKNKEVLDLSLLGFDEPTFELVLAEPMQFKNKSIQRIFFTVDDERAFYELVNQRRGNQ